MQLPLLAFLQAQHTYVICFVGKEITMDSVRLENLLSVVKRDVGGVNWKVCLYQLPITTITLVSECKADFLLKRSLYLTVWKS